MLFRTSVNLLIFSCISLTCFSHGSPKNNEYKALKLYFMDIDAQEAKSLCNDIIASTDEFSSISIEANSCTNAVTLTGRASEVDQLQYSLRDQERVFQDNEYKLLVLDDFMDIDVQVIKSFCDAIIASNNKFASVKVAIDVLNDNSLILSGQAYEVYLLENYIDRYIDNLKNDNA